MPFGHHNLSVLAYANGFTHFLYKAGDTPLSEVCARGYFNDGRTLLVPGSMLTIVTTNGCTIRFVGRSPDDHVITRAPAVVEEAPDMEQPFGRFHAGLRRLLNLDRPDVPFLSGEDWQRFRTDPFRFFIRADDETAEKLWEVMEHGQ